MVPELLSFAKRLSIDVQDAAELGNTDSGEVYSESIFTEKVLEHLSSIGMVENATVCHHESTTGKTIVKINAYAINDDETHLDLFTTIYVDAGEPKIVPRDEIVKAGERALRFYEAAAGGFHKSLEPAGDAFEAASRINSIEGSIDRVRVFVLTDGLSSSKKIPDREVLGTHVRFEVWDIERLYRGMLAGVPRDEIDIDFVELNGAPIPCLPVPRSSEDYEAYLAVLPGEVLYKLYDEFGARLLELNVRSFLGVKGSKTVNNGIRKTLQSSPSQFLAYNNGIVVTVDGLKLEILADGTSAIRSVKGLQIVNGGQTTASIHRAHKVDGTNLSLVQVPAKISLIAPEKLDAMVQMISRYANSQNTVQPADFSANHPFHVKIDELSKSVWCPDGLGRWFYERARGSYQVAQEREVKTTAQQKKFKERTPPGRKFTKPELAKYLNAWDQKPHLVSFGDQKNFDNFMQNLASTYRDDWLPDQSYYRQLIAKAIVFRTVQKIVREEKFPASKANIAAYLVACLSRLTSQKLDLEGIWKAQQLSSALIAALRSWAHIIDKRLRETAKERQVSEWAKKEACWEEIRDEPLPLPDELPAEMASYHVVEGDDPKKVRTRIEALSPEDYRNIEACKRINGETWLRVHAWGKKTKELQKWQFGIAHSLAGLAAVGWDNGPSPKQARQGVIILQRAKEAGVLKDVSP
jgi:hypothetical protein